MITTTLTYLMILVSFDQTPKSKEPKFIDQAKVWQDMYNDL